MSTQGPFHFQGPFHIYKLIITFRLQNVPIFGKFGAEKKVSYAFL